MKVRSDREAERATDELGLHARLQSTEPKAASAQYARIDEAAADDEGFVLPRHGTGRELLALVLPHAEEVAMLVDLADEDDVRLSFFLLHRAEEKFGARENTGGLALSEDTARGLPKSSFLRDTLNENDDRLRTFVAQHDSFSFPRSRVPGCRCTIAKRERVVNGFAKNVHFLLHILGIFPVLYFFHMKQKERYGFTLIELLVVIGIIGLLASLSVVALASVQKKGRDAKRHSDTATITKALELYRVRNELYPANGGICLTGTDAISNLLRTDFLTVPPDPVTTTSTTATPASGATPHCYWYASPDSATFSLQYYVEATGETLTRTP